jgi:hypothetical protein
MRRGLLSWSEDEVPRTVLDARVERCRAAMRDDGLDALIVYTSFPRPAAVSWLTHFVPYWNQGVLVVPADGPTALVVSLSQRVAGWIRETARVGEIVSTPRLGETVARKVLGTGSGPLRVGAVELPKLSAALARPVAGAEGRVSLVDATDLFAAIRNPADATEIALARRAAGIAAGAFAEATAGRPGDIGEIAAVAERVARRAGIEEILIDAVPDLAAGAALHRVEGGAPLGTRYAVRLSIAYKGHWVRYGRTITPDGPVDGGLSEMLPALADGVATLGGVTVEGCTGCSPLVSLSALPPGAVVSLGLSRDQDGSSVVASEPLVLPVRPGDRPERLAAVAGGRL